MQRERSVGILARLREQVERPTVIARDEPG